MICGSLFLKTLRNRCASAMNQVNSNKDVTTNLERISRTLVLL